MAQDLTQYENATSLFFENLQKAAFDQIKCIFCEKQDIKILFQKGTMRVVKCRCGLVFNATPPSGEALNKFYQKSDSMKYWETFKRTETEAKRQTEKFELAVNVITRGEPESVCDIGCGTGFFLEMLRKRSKDTVLWGVDPGIESRDVDGIHFIKEDFYNFFEDCATFDTKFNVITMWGVLEHVKAPFLLLDMAKKQLTQDGVIVICVPNCQSEIVETLWDKCFTFCPQHLWYFNKNTLNKAMEKCGFKMIDFYTIEPEELPITRHLMGLDPYEKNTKLEKKIQKKAFGFAEWILQRKRGYKIVAIGRHAHGSGNNTRKSGIEKHNK